MAVAFRKRAVFIEWDGRRILCIDYAGLADHAEAADAFAQVHAAVSAEPPGSVLTLSDVRDTHLDRAMMRRLAEMTVRNAPFVRAAAVVGLRGDQRRDLGDTERIARREFKVFETLEAARDWLAVQG